MEASGESVNFPRTLNLHSYLFSNPFQHIQNPDPERYPNHTYNGQPIPPHRPVFVHGGTGTQISWQRLKLDSLKVARSLNALVGTPVKLVPSANPFEPIHAPRTTVCLHLPNSQAWALLSLGALAANCTVCPVSSLLSPRELSHILAKARPQVLVTTVGQDGEGKLRKALHLLLEGEEKDNGLVKGHEIRAWARELAVSWDAGRASRSQRSEQLPFRQRRVWTVNLGGSADYYGSGFEKTGIPASVDPRDWSNLLLPPPGSKQEGTFEGTDSAVFSVEPMSEEEQRRRVAFLLWSSGTTGQSKGVLLSHQAAISNTAGIWRHNRHFNGAFKGAFGDGERWLALAPWCHVYGLSTLFLTAIAMGATVVLPASPAFDLTRYLRMVSKYRATFAHIAPAAAFGLRSTPALTPGTPESQGVDVSSVSGMLSGGAPVPTEVIAQVYKRSGKYIHMGYGNTETFSVAQTRAVGIEDDELGSSGVPTGNMAVRIQPLPGTTVEQTRQRGEEIRQRAKEARAKGGSGPLDPSEPGEILVRGASVMLGYYSGHSSEGGTSALDATLTDGAFYDGRWYRSGDEGVLDAKGNLWITGRTKELIKIKGFQVPPAELDALFAQHPDLVDAAATGVVADKELGTEQVVLLAVPSDKSILNDKPKLEALAAKLAQWVADQTAYYKWPSQYLFAANCPRSPNGKILRKDVAAWPGVLVKAPKIGRRSAKL